MRQSDSIGKLALALAKAQAKLPNIPKSRTAKVRSKRTDTEYSYSYADISDVLAIVRPILAAEELAVVQLAYMDGDLLMLDSRLVHSSGEWMSSVYPVCRLAGHQDMGGALTYARRYSYCALIGVAAEDDDDGASAGQPQKMQPKEKPAANGAGRPAATERKAASVPAASLAAEAHPVLVSLETLHAKVRAVLQDTGKYSSKALKGFGTKADTAWNAWLKEADAARAAMTDEQRAAEARAVSAFKADRWKITDAAVRIAEAEAAGADTTTGELAYEPVRTEAA